MSIEMTAERGRRRLEDLYAAHGPEAVCLAFLLTGDRDLAEDLAQDAFVRVARRFGDLRRPEAFGPYLRKTVVNLCKGHWRRRKIERTYLARATVEQKSATSELPASALATTSGVTFRPCPTGSGRPSYSGSTRTSPSNRPRTCSTAPQEQPGSWWPALGGFLGVTAIDGTPDDIDVAKPQVIAPGKPVRFASGRIEDTRWSLAARATADGICVTVDDETKKSGQIISANSVTHFGISGDNLSLTQVSFEDVDPVLVFGTVPPGAHRAELVLEDGSTEDLGLELGGRVAAGEPYYVTEVEDAATKGAVVFFDRNGTEIGRRALCAPRAPQMSNRRGISPPLFCGDGGG
jgi:hypothetical protein